MKRTLLSLVSLALCSSAHAGDPSTYKKDVALWYTAFDKHDPAILGKILNENWQESPTELGTKPAGKKDVMGMLVKLTTTFPDFRIKIEDIIQEGNKLVVRSEITGTQAKDFRGFPSKGRKMRIQAIDIHEFKDGQIIHTWHSEDWMSGLHQLGIL